MSAMMAFFLNIFYDGLSSDFNLLTPAYIHPSPVVLPCNDLRSGLVLIVLHLDNFIEFIQSVDSIH
jgi:hypothetical protein